MKKISIQLVVITMLLVAILTVQVLSQSEDQYKNYAPHVPTGCPYGDSIPLDDPKCVPPPVEAVQPIVEPTPEPVKARTCDL